MAGGDARTSQRQWWSFDDCSQLHVGIDSSAWELNQSSVENSHQRQCDYLVHLCHIIYIFVNTIAFIEKYCKRTKWYMQIFFWMGGGIIVSRRLYNQFFFFFFFSVRFFRDIFSLFVCEFSYCGFHFYGGLSGASHWIKNRLQRTR